MTLPETLIHAFAAFGLIISAIIALAAILIFADHIFSKHEPDEHEDGSVG